MEAYTGNGADAPHRYSSVSQLVGHYSWVGHGSTKQECPLTFRHRASSILRQASRYSPENAFYIFNQQIYFIV